MDVLAKSYPLINCWDEDDLSSIATRTKGSKMNMWKLQNETAVHPFFPCTDITQAMHHLLLYEQKFPDRRSPFPPIRPPWPGLEFASALSPPIVTALMYQMLTDCCCVPEAMSVETVHIVRNFLLIRSRDNDDHPKQFFDVVTIDGESIFADHMEWNE
jgi:hypothetical protein